jgi:hypothetical protein
MQRDPLPPGTCTQHRVRDLFGSFPARGAFHTCHTWGVIQVWKVW